jgi:hypothetical protein
MTSRDDSKKNIENFENKSYKIIFIIFAIILPLIVLGIRIYEDFFSSKNLIKSLTSSTSPGFNLTHTPNMK